MAYPTSAPALPEDPPAPRLAVLGLGSNLGDRAAYLLRAVQHLGEVPGIILKRLSPLLETVPVGPIQAQPMFYNQGLLIETTLPPHALLDACLTIELTLGRDRTITMTHKGPRTIDIDILWVEGVTVNDATLTLPHPAILERPFTLHALAHLVPTALTPDGTQTFATRFQQTTQPPLPASL